MGSKQTIVINGKVYDAVTGLPVAAPQRSARVETVIARPLEAVQQSPQPVRSTNHAAVAHQNVQRSKTLRRDILKKPVEKAKVGSAKRRPEAGRVARSQAISRFAPHPQPIQPVKKAIPRLDITPNRPKAAAIVATKHALVTRPQQPRTVEKPTDAGSAKEQLISKRLAQIQQDSHVGKSKKEKRSGHSRAFSIATASLAIMILGGYLTYLSMPGLSVRVAAAQAGVTASFPEYSPDGYRFSGPVAYAPGQVAIDFLANGGTTKYTLTEQKSTWDSQAVYDNVVAKDADDSYVTNSQQGLTIYTYKGHAAWVNGGILYTIEGDAPLTNEQLLKIAGSL